MVPRAGWTLLFADSQENGSPATNAFDGDPNTIWHTQFSPTSPLPPHELRINLGATYTMSGFRYLPRQDSANGRIAEYEFYISADGVTWGTPVASGRFSNDAIEKEILFAPVTGHYVRLRALSEVNDQPWTTVAELNLLQAQTGVDLPPTSSIISPLSDATIVVGSAIEFNGTANDPDGNLPLIYRWSFSSGSHIADSSAAKPGLVRFDTPGTFTVTFTVADALGLVGPTSATRTITVLGGGTAIPKVSWSLRYADSQEASSGNVATNAFDGNTSTFWHTQFVNGAPYPPHEIQIDLGASHTIGGFRYLPRQDGGQNGNILQYEFFVSNDGAYWGSPVATSVFVNNSAEKEVAFAPVPGRYVRMVAMSEVNGAPWTSIAELTVLEAPIAAPSVMLVQPKMNYLQNSTDLDVVALANVTAGQGVRISIDGGSSMGGAQYDFTSLSSSYEVIFTGMSIGLHVVDAFVIDGGGATVSGAATHDEAANAGVGNYYVALGDSITFGYADDIPTDNTSADGRTTGGGFEPILADSLTSANPRPHLVVNAAVPGHTSADGVTQSMAVLQKHPSGTRFLVMYGTNDAGKGVASGVGLHPGDSGYRGSFKDNMQQIINNLVKAGKTVFVAKPPAILPLNSIADQRLQQNIQVINELASDPVNQISLGPDFRTYFAAHTGTDYAPDGVHPNGVGYRDMAQLWFQALPPE